MTDASTTINLPLKESAEAEFESHPKGVSRMPRVEFYREPVLDDYLDNDRPIGAVAIKYKVSIEDIFDILYYKKISTPSYLERRVQEYIDKMKSMAKLSKKLNCSRKLLQAICLRLKHKDKEMYPRFIRYVTSKDMRTLPSSINDMDVLIQEIRSDREIKVSVEESCKRLGIGNRKYYTLVNKYNLPIKEFFPGEEEYAEQIRQDRDNGVSMRESVDKLGGTYYGYYKVIHRKNMPLSKHLCY